LKFLLDTHIWLWSLLEPERLSRRVRQELEKSGNEFWLSPISTWELLLLLRKGLVVLNEDVVTWVAKAFRAFPLMEAPLTHEVALQTGRLKLLHQDPADHFQAATARVFGLTLITADDRLRRAGNLRVLVNR
jgi:PIN domain nuclease of toxin-antitoxin system